MDVGWGEVGGTVSRNEQYIRFEIYIYIYRQGILNYTQCFDRIIVLPKAT